ncbi:MAG TPA: hypothetical protein VGY48_01750, partial [Vicinamibacterales bacterium]|nr:hypothetical protein [Vicinamibacterales bacterium]
MRIELVPGQSREKGADGRPGIADQAVVNLGAPAQLLSANVDLHDAGAFGIELLVREVGANHQEHVAVH